MAGLTKDRIWLIFSFRKALKLRRVRAYIKKFAIMFKYVRLRQATNPIGRRLMEYDRNKYGSCKLGD